MMQMMTTIARRTARTLSWVGIALAGFLSLVAAPPAHANQLHDDVQRVRDWVASIPGDATGAFPEVFDAVKELADLLDDVPRTSWDKIKLVVTKVRAAVDRALERLRSAPGTAAAGASPILTEVLLRFAENVIVKTSGTVRNADGTPAGGVVVVQFVPGDAITGSGAWLPYGIAVSDADGRYEIWVPAGIAAAARSLTGLAQAQGEALVPMRVAPVQLLPPAPPYQELTYSAAGVPTVAAGQAPMSVWNYLGL